MATSVEKAPGEVDETASDSSNSSSPIASRATSSSDLKPLDSHGSNANVGTVGAEQQQPVKLKQSLEERSRIPYSFLVTLATVLSLQYSVGFWRVESFVSWKDSMLFGAQQTRDALTYLRTLMESLASGNAATDWKEVAVAGVATFLIGTTLYVLIVAPLMAGFWTGPRTSKHKIHRYMGLAYLVQYFLAWVEFVSNYDDPTKDSIIPHFIALNGLVQGYSAYFSFKVLPDAVDPGYYSDKAVASRKFIHENIFFSLMAVWGSVYYYQGNVDKLQANPLGRVVETIFLFFPYVVVRPFFPTTSFSKGGSGRQSRSDKNAAFYHYGTLSVKFFYLWAKYFLGFFVNIAWSMKITTPEQAKFLRGMFLLNVGTVSIAIFLHTLRFRKVLPAKFTFSLYLLQIWA
jgi:hypothetical protein